MKRTRTRPSLERQPAGREAPVSSPLRAARVNLPVAAVASAGALPLPDKTIPDRGAYNRGHPRKKAGDPPDTGIDGIAEVVLAGQVLRS